MLSGSLLIYFQTIGLFPQMMDGGRHGSISDPKELKRADEGTTTMHIIIHRGTHEIGGNCVEIGTDKSRIILDVGMPLFRADGEPHDSADLKKKTKKELLDAGIIPKVPGLFVDGTRPDAILLSHAHEDHTGLLRHCNEEIPIYASRGTSKMMKAGERFALQPTLPRNRHQEFESNIPIEIGDFKVTAYSVNHSIYGAQAFLLEAEGKTVLYSGDLRMHGRKPEMHKSLIEAVSRRNIDVLLMEGTHIGHPGHTGRNEYELEDEIRRLIQKAPGLVLASFSPQHVDRLECFLGATKDAGRIFVADAYTAFVMHLIASETDIPRPESSEWVKVFFPKYFEESYQRKNLEGFHERISPARIRMEEIRSNPSQYVMLFRPSMMESDFKGNLPERSKCLYSRWTGYLEQPEWRVLTSVIEGGGGDLIEVHTSGHIYADDIVKLVGQIKPKTVVPIHTFEPERFTAFSPNVKLLKDGEIHRI